MGKHPNDLEVELIHPWLRQSHIVLDLGCGQTGKNSIRLAKMCGYVVGVDHKIPSTPMKNVTWIQQDVRACTKKLRPDTMFHFVQARLLLQSLPKEDALAMLRALAGHVRTGGRVYVLTWFQQPSGSFPTHRRTPEGDFEPWTFYRSDEIISTFPDWRVVWEEESKHFGKGRHTGEFHNFFATAVILERPRP